MKTRCLPREWQAPWAAENPRVEEGELLLRKGTLILSGNSTLWIWLFGQRSPQWFLVFLGGEGAAVQLFLGSWCPVVLGELANSAYLFVVMEPGLLGWVWSSSLEYASIG